MMSSRYTVTGMTCAHCVKAVTDEVSKVPGVVEVNVDLAAGGLDVTSDRQLADESIRQAVEEAGYELTRP